MKSLVRLLWVPIFFVLFGCAGQKKNEIPEVVVLIPDEEIDLTEPSDISFTRDIVPILSRCTPCHYSDSEMTELSFQTRDGMLADRAGGRPVLVPGNPEKSTLFLVTRLPEYFVEAMPPSGHRLTEDQVWKLYTWIYQDAPWPEKIVLPGPQTSN